MSGSRVTEAYKDRAVDDRRRVEFRIVVLYRKESDGLRTRSGWAASR